MVWGDNFTPSLGSCTHVCWLWEHQYHVSDADSNHILSFWVLIPIRVKLSLSRPCRCLLLLLLGDEVCSDIGEFYGHASSSTLLRNNSLIKGNVGMIVPKEENPCAECLYMPHRTSGILSVMERIQCNQPTTKQVFLGVVTYQGLSTGFHYGQVS